MNIHNEKLPPSAAETPSWIKGVETLLQMRLLRGGPCLPPSRGFSSRVRWHLPPTQALPAAPRAPCPQLPGPGEQNGRVVVQRVGIPLHVDAFLPLAEAPQGVVCEMSDLQVLLQAESTATEALRQGSEESGQILLPRKAGDRDPEVAAGRPVSPRPVSSLTTPPTGTFQRGPKRGSAGVTNDTVWAKEALAVPLHTRQLG